MDRSKIDELTQLMLKVDQSMAMTREKQTMINNMKSNLMEETRPMYIEQSKIKIEEKENEKAEFDEMTTNGLIQAKTQIKKIREESEQEYQNKLLETLEKKKQIEKKLELMEKKGLTEEKITMAKFSAEKALAKVNEEIKTYQEKHFDLRKKLNEMESDIDNYALELGVDIEPLENEKEPEEKKMEEKKPEEKKPEVKKPEEKKPEVKKPEEKKPEVKKPEVKKPEEKKSEEKKPEIKKPEVKKLEVKKPEEKKSEENKTLPKVVSVEFKDEKYIFTSETKKNGVYSISRQEFEKIGILRRLVERYKLVKNRKEYGIDLITVMRADPNISRHLNDKDKETYLNYIAGETAKCFDIDYHDPKNKYAKALTKGKERLALREKEALDKFGPIEDFEWEEEIAHEFNKNKYDEMFGKGFEQRHNPPKISATPTSTSSFKQEDKDVEK
mgnify:CR=1 FL=1